MSINAKLEEWYDDMWDAWEDVTTCFGCGDDNGDWDPDMEDQEEDHGRDRGQYLRLGLWW